MMEGRALDANIKIELHCDQEEIKIVADRRAVMQMTLNLLSNAVKFSKQNGFVNLALKESENFVTIIVEDQGIGIPANKLANITMPFEQAETDYTREYEGSGLGLSITKELAELHSGQLAIESTWNVGTKVTIKLPKNQK
jgi:two-component system cell cycle sensor histidine kinase PleC